MAGHGQAGFVDAAFGGDSEVAGKGVLGRSGGVFGHFRRKCRVFSRLRLSGQAFSALRKSFGESRKSFGESGKSLEESRK